MHSLTNGVNDLVNHDFAEFEFTVALLIVISTVCDHSDTLTVVALNAKASISVAGSVSIFVIIKCRSSRLFTDAAITLSTSFVVLPSQIKRLQE
ncbi:hypothetical protein RRF57_010823 [Xylaria bambusicola]|uniref:Uncharacterized protein n=1 Tax=Xylaria bambusicola TaxID=326684 RepID=A0AAN7UYN5_9PEZI